MMKSYAQNFEDVLLWRVLRDVSPGFYIDLGAQHPVLDSVSRWFYEQGWRGIHVEPLQFYADLLRRDRPDEDVIQAAISDEPGTLLVYAFPDTGLSTISFEIASVHKAKLGREWVEQKVPSLSLEDLFGRAARSDVHWLKIDVEGHERSAIASWGDCVVRPWVVVVEATYPNTQDETHEEWEFLLLSRGYSFVYADGLNRYYLHEAHEDRRERFRYPPNYFDQFTLSEHWATSELRADNERRLSDAIAAQQLAESEKEQAMVRASEFWEAMQQTQKEITEGHARYLSAISGLSDNIARTAEEFGRVSRNFEHNVNQVMATAAEVRIRMDKTSARADENRELLRRVDLRVSENAAHLEARLEALSSRFEELCQGLHRITSGRWWMLKVLLGFQKEGLLVRHRASNTGAPSRQLIPFSGGERAARGDREQGSRSDGRGSRDLTEEDPPQPYTLADLFALPPEHFVAAAYRILLGREADVRGVSHYLDKWALGHSRSDVLRDIVRGREYRSRARCRDLMRLNDHEFIDLAYRRILGRGPDDAGRDHYVSRLRSGTARARVLNDLAKSSEAQTRADPTLRLRDQIQAHITRQYGLSGWLKSPWLGRSARQMSQLEFSLSTATHRIRLDLDRQVRLLRADIEKSRERNFSPGRASGNWTNLSSGLQASASRPRWTPRDVQAARATVPADKSEVATSPHPDFIALSGRMKKEAPFGELRNAHDGQEQLDDFLEGAYSTEDHGSGPVRWIAREASAYLRVAGRRFHIQAAGFFAQRSVLVLFGNTVIGTLCFGTESEIVSVPVDSWTGKDVVISLKCDDVINPEAAGINSDQRDLGVLIHTMYFD